MESSECILVAEDNRVLRYVAAHLLSSHGYCVIEARDGLEALERDAEYDGVIHLLVTNAEMPEMDGHELAFKMKKKRPNLKVLIISGSHEKDLPPEARGHDFGLIKPVDMKLILEKVQYLLQGSHTKPTHL